MAVYEPPNNYFNNINYNTDFYQVPNDELDGISAAYANTHYLQISQGTTPISQASNNRFNGYIGIGTNPSTLYGLDVKSFSGIKVQHETAGNGFAVLGPASNATRAGAIYLYNGTPSIVGILGSGNTNITNYLDLIANSPYLGWCINSNLAINGNCGIGTSPSATIGLDVRSSSGLRVQHTTAGGTVSLIGSTTTSSLGSIVFNDGFGINGSIGGGLVNGSYINMASVFGVTQGYSVSGNFIVNSNCIIAGTTFNTNAAFDVGGTATTTRYSFLNGLRISGRDANTIWQDITTSNINITTSGTSQYIGFNIGNGTQIAAITSSGLQMASTKGIGIGTTPELGNSLTVTNTTIPGINVNGTNSRLSLNSDKIRLGFVTGSGVYSLNSIANDFVIFNETGRILLSPNNANYAHVIMTTSGVGITNFYNTTTGTSNASINGDGVINCVSITANSATVKNSLTLTGGTPLTLTTAINASAGTQVSNYVTVAPYGYLLWGGGNNSGVVAFSANTGTAYSIRGDYAIIGGGFISYSDKRIKRDIKPIENSLEIVDKIEPKNYNIIETAENRYGFIAQEVEEVIPNAVVLSYDFIPNIFDYGNYDDKIITFDNKNNLELVEGDEVKINYECCRVEEVIDKDSFRIHKKLEVDETKKVFIMGTKVKDFKCINYDMITSINTAAIKELHSIIKQQQEQIAFLMTKIGMV